MKRQTIPMLVDLDDEHDAPLQIIAFPHAGGAPAFFANWVPQLEDVHLRAVQLPGHGARLGEAPLDSMDAIVRELAPIAAALDRPTVFFGHSLGAIVAFRLIRWLEANRRPLPIHFFASGRRAPHRPQRTRVRADLDATTLRRELAELGGTPPQVLANDELMELYLPTIRADLGIAERFHDPPGIAVGCPLSAFGGDADPEVSADDLRGWRDHARGWFNQRTFTGGHFYFDDPDQVIAAMLVDLLAAAPG